MYTIDRTDYGTRVCIGLETMGYYSLTEMEELVKEMTDRLERLRKPIAYFYDFRNLQKLPPEEMQLFMQFKANLVERGVVKRSAFIMNSPVLMLQMKRISRDVGLLSLERFIDSTINQNWEDIALAWLINAQDPNLKKRR